MFRCLGRTAAAVIFLLALGGAGCAGTQSSGVFVAADAGPWQAWQAGLENRSVHALVPWEGRMLAGTDSGLFAAAPGGKWTALAGTAGQGLAEYLGPVSLREKAGRPGAIGRAAPLFHAGRKTEGWSDAAGRRPR